MLSGSCDSMLELYSVNKVVLMICVSTHQSSFEIVILVNRYELDKG